MQNNDTARSVVENDRKVLNPLFYTMCCVLLLQTHLHICNYIQLYTVIYSHYVQYKDNNFSLESKILYYLFY
jgi:hypothetical protein